MVSRTARLQELCPERASIIQTRGHGHYTSGVLIALKVPAVFGAELDPDEILSNCQHLGAHAIELAASTVEALLGKPTVPSWWIEMPENGFETGALPLEEEILQDEIDLARQTYIARIRDWRGTVSLAPLEKLRTKYEDGGVRIATVNWTDLSRCSDAEVDYGFNVAKALGADALVTPLVVGEPRRLARFADRHARRIAFQNDIATRPADAEAALTHSPRNALSLDLHRWAAGGHGSPVPFLRQHVDRVIQVYVEAGDTGDEAGSEIAREVLDEIRANDWPLQVTIGLA
jgi:hypothetical protein